MYTLVINCKEVSKWLRISVAVYLKDKHERIVFTFDIKTKYVLATTVLLCINLSFFKYLHLLKSKNTKKIWRLISEWFNIDKETFAQK